MDKTLKDFTTREILNELVKRDKEGDPDFTLHNETVTSYTFKFWKYE
jgi:hypothetical protein